MNESTFKLTGDYIELIKLLKLLRLAESGSHAQFLVKEGLVKVNHKIESRKRAKLRSGDEIEVNGIRLRIG
jgi:ribosome-associated protein